MRKTNETEISMFLNLDGIGERKIETPVGFLNHMLDLFTKHGLFDLEINATGDNKLYNDEHHVVEDIGIVLGKLLLKLWETKKESTDMVSLSFLWMKRW